MKNYKEHLYSLPYAPGGNTFLQENTSRPIPLNEYTKHLYKGPVNEIDASMLTQVAQMLQGIDPATLAQMAGTAGGGAMLSGFMGGGEGLIGKLNPMTKLKAKGGQLFDRAMDTKYGSKVKGAINKVSDKMDSALGLKKEPVQLSAPVKQEIKTEVGSQLNARGIGTGANAPAPGTSVSQIFANARNAANSSSSGSSSSSASPSTPPPSPAASGAH